MRGEEGGGRLNDRCVAGVPRMSLEAADPAPLYPKGRSTRLTNALFPIRGLARRVALTFGLTVMGPPVSGCSSTRDVWGVALFVCVSS